MEKVSGLLSLQLEVGLAYVPFGLPETMLKADLAGQPHNSKTVGKKGK